MADSLVGLHGTDPASVHLSARARLATDLRADSVALVERALYDERRLVRTLGMRRTMFVVPVELVPIVQAAVTEALVPGERRRTVAMMESSGVAPPGQCERRLRELADETATTLERLGEATAVQLTKVVPGLGTQMRVATARREDVVGLSTRVLFLLSCEQRIVRGRPEGGWTSSRHRWAPMTGWFEGEAPLAPPVARAELARRWLRSFGPATVDDLKWWTGWTLGHTRAALADAGAVEIRLGADDGVDAADVAGVAAGDDELLDARVDDAVDGAPWVALLPALDPTTMGWRDRSWYLGDHRAALFDRNGNAGPTVWVDGRIVGGWSQRADGEVRWRLLEDVGRDVGDAVADEAAALQVWLGDVRVRPRFPTPLDVELRR